MPEEIGTRDVLEQMNTRLGNVERDIRGLRSEINARFEARTRWLAGLILLSWLSLMVSILAQIVAPRPADSPLHLTP